MKYIKTFQRFLKEDRDKYYTLDLPKKLNDDDVAYLMNELMKLTFKMKKEGNVRVTLEPVFEGEEE